MMVRVARQTTTWRRTHRQAGLQLHEANLIVEAAVQFYSIASKGIGSPSGSG